VRVLREHDGVQVRVTDTGIGLAPEAIPGLFSMFSQVKSALDRAEGGLGIGLALARGLVELHDGTIAAESAGFGKGSTFIVRLPALPAESRASGDEARPDAGPAGQRRCKVLVVDDNRDAADSLAMLIGLDGHEVRMAHDGLEALEVGAQFRPDFMLLDIGMPKLNGYAVAQRLRREAWGERVVLVALTGWGSREDRERAFESGFNHHLTKPVDPDLVRALMSGDEGIRASSSAAAASRESSPASIARASTGRPVPRV
jgi:CheY-like chemotaxis protein